MPSQDQAMGRDLVLARVTAPLYSYAESDYLAAASAGTTRRWIDGYRYRDREGRQHFMPPVTPRADALSQGISFQDLVEVAAISRLKKAGFSLRAVREIVQNCQRILKVERPLTTLRFKTDGRELFVTQGDDLIEVRKRGGQRAWDQALEPFLEELEYEYDLAERWWPLGRETPVVIDPRYGFGLPVVEDSGVRADIVLERYNAGDSREQISYDFSLGPDEVDAALRFATKRAA